MAAGATPEALFLPADPGQRFLVYHRPAGRPRAAVVLAQPFAEEMNKSRRMSALLAQALAAVGIAVAHPDLLGCGDSSGDFADARWNAWQADILLAAQWLQRRADVPIHLMGLRLGAMLAVDVAASGAMPVASLTLWQPVVSGEAFINQFLRLAVAGDALRGGVGTGTQALRSALQAGEPVEIGGYVLAPELATAIAALDLVEIASPGVPVHWIDVRAGPAPPASERALARLRERGIPVSYDAVPGEPFWTTQEIAQVPQLIETTVAALARRTATA